MVVWTTVLVTYYVVGGLVSSTRDSLAQTLLFCVKVLVLLIVYQIAWILWCLWAEKLWGTTVTVSALRIPVFFCLFYALCSAVLDPGSIVNIGVDGNRVGVAGHSAWIVLALAVTNLLCIGWLICEVRNRQVAEDLGVSDKISWNYLPQLVVSCTVCAPSIAAIRVLVTEDFSGNDTYGDLDALRAQPPPRPDKRLIFGVVLFLLLIQAISVGVELAFRRFNTPRRRRRQSRALWCGILWAMNFFVWFYANNYEIYGILTALAVLVSLSISSIAGCVWGMLRLHFSVSAANSARYTASASHS